MLHDITSTSQVPGFVEDVIAHLLTWRRARKACALITLVNVEGSSPRPEGSQMAVREDGRVVGEITAGCAHAAIVTQALAQIAQGKNTCIRYGKGSKYLDVALPCGSGIDIHFDTQIGSDVLEQLQAKKAQRIPVSLSINTATANSSATVTTTIGAGTGTQPAIDRNRFTRTYMPGVRIVIVGTGHMVACLARFTKTLNWELAIASPQQETLEASRALGADGQHLKRPQDFDATIIDPWTASVVLFHDHEWEPEILNTMLASDGFYVGALGSRQTHARRRAALSNLGCKEEQISRVHGPVGLDLGARTPPEIALSIVAQILAQYRSIPCRSIR